MDNYCDFYFPLNISFQIAQQMNKDIQAYNDSQSSEDRGICNLLSQEVSRNLPEAESRLKKLHDL